MVDEYRDERARQVARAEGELRQDESAPARVVVFRSWLRSYEWPPSEALAAWSADRWAS